ncbi:glycosyl transferase family 2 [Pedobacter yonginense]|uniref:Glycosyl transferase family 2 n=1 Tax=Pedobacter yonginense TaxID=651869 RepID=A0A317ELC3_9SPHI|nr:GtrA family protein [Pedobacter yonginense]PWS27384.1 glycosyl transferase family 2 [Pedobacter yonginense]
MDLILRILKFGLTGLFGMAIDFGATWLFKEKIKVNKYVANAIGFSLAVTNNYLINRIWTFQSTNAHWGTEFSKFLVVSLIGLGLNTIIIYLFHQRKNGANFYVAKFFAIIIVFVWNFLANMLFTFK